MQALRDCLRRLAEEARHFGSVFQMAFGIGLKLAASVIEAHAEPDRRQHIL